MDHFKQNENRFSSYLPDSHKIPTLISIYFRLTKRQTLNILDPLLTRRKTKLQLGGSQIRNVFFGLPKPPRRKRKFYVAVVPFCYITVKHMRVENIKKLSTFDCTSLRNIYVPPCEQNDCICSNII